MVDFGRDEYKMSEEELKLLANKVRVGDLTDVLRVWEKDIKVRPLALPSREHQTDTST